MPIAFSAALCVHYSKEDREEVWRKDKREVWQERVPPDQRETDAGNRSFAKACDRLSRVRGLDCLVSSGLNEKIRDIMEKGPPEVLVGNFNKIFGQKIKQTRRSAREARKALGWPLPES